MTAAALLVVLAGIAAVRAGWGGRRRVAAAGWAAILAGAGMLTSADGAWGLAVATVVVIMGALTMVLHAGWRSPPKVQRPLRETPAVALPRRASGLLRRGAVFLLVIPVGFAAAQWLAFGLQAFARTCGMGETDATVLTLFLQPLLWLAILTVQMTRARTMQMVAAPAMAALAGTLLWSAA